MYLAKRSKFLPRFFSVFLCLAIIFLLVGCEGDSDEDSSGVDVYFKTNPFSSEARQDSTLATELEISPTFGKVSIVGQTILFTASGGNPSYSWGVSTTENGHIDITGWSQAVYVCDRIGNNDVLVQDEDGHRAVAHITPAEDTMTITPESPVNLESADLYASFAVSGGTPPYTWSVGNPSLGTISYSASTSYVAGYSAVSSAYGSNEITVRDAEGRVASVTVIRTLED